MESATALLEESRAGDSVEISRPTARVLTLSTCGFTLFFAVWAMFAIVGVPLRKELGRR